MLEFSLSDAVFAVVNFLLLLLLLRLVLYRPVQRMLEERRVRIEEGLAEAEQAKSLAAETEAQAQTQIEAARDEAERILEAARAHAEELHKQIVAEAREEARQMTLKAQAAVEVERAEAMEKLRQRAVMLAVSMADRMLAEEMSAEQKKALLDKFISRVGQAQ